MRNGSQRVLLGGLVLALSVVWAGPAPARGGGRDHRERDQHASKYDDHRGGRHDRYERRHRRGRDRQRGYRARRHDSYRGVPRYYHGNRASGYYCAACRHGYGSRASFHDHLIGAHHIPIWQIPFVIVNGIVGGVLSWVFYG